MEGVKVEIEVDFITGGGGVAAALSNSPRPMEGLHEVGPPPFLSKTYEMVEDPSSDAVISWSRAKNSFIVWNSNEFSITLLPKYFKHSNFSSFILMVILKCLLLLEETAIACSLCLFR
ncbi:hypothetical protein BUALT_Bualt05G0009700 [Buddleja alternifolia]|uniref:HSF-type DNA-binding domain-containing protein n=1 Tax=Buddleja alternifolia TaxID=168488 RepID=A0AAV6XHF1_9LAMI|nr:hypothetical protein BUALT_Bualt05G0009700 [Buddleja alternifolia]